MLSNGVFVQNLYSQGLYTEAAANSLYTWQNILDEYGYYYCYYYQLNNKSNNMYKSFHAREYETFAFIYPYYLFGNSVLQKSIDAFIQVNLFFLVFGMENFLIMLIWKDYWSKETIKSW